MMFSSCSVTMCNINIDTSNFMVFPAPLTGLKGEVVDAVHGLPAVGRMLEALSPSVLRPKAQGMIYGI